MIRAIVYVLFAVSLLSAAGCKKKEGDSSGSSSSGGTSGPPSSGIPECEAYFKAMDKFVTCDHVQPQAAKDAYKQANDKMRADIAGAKDKAAALEQCKQAMTELVAGAKDRNCPLE